MIIAVPSEGLTHEMVKNISDDCLAYFQVDIDNPEKEGVFVCTHDKLLSLSDEAIKGTMLMIDEYHQFYHTKGSADKMVKAKFVVACSATLGEIHGMLRIQYELKLNRPDVGVAVLNSKLRIEKEGELALEVIQSNAENRIKKVTAAVKRLVQKDANSVVVFCKTIKEC